MAGEDGEDGVGEAGRVWSVSLWMLAVVEDEEREWVRMLVLVLLDGRGWCWCWCLWPNAQQMSAQT